MFQVNVKNTALFLLTFISFTGGTTKTLAPSADIRSAIQTSQAGDTLLLDDGDYQSPGWLDNIKFIPSILIKAKNPLRARFVSGNGLNINNCKGLNFDGFEISTLSTNSGLIQIQGQSSYISISNCHIHHAPLDADCIKVNQANNITIINCHLHDPGARAAGNGLQETLDYVDVDTGVIRGCFFTGGTSRQYVNAKGLSSYIVVENCILKDHNGDQGDAAIILGGWSSSNIFSGSTNGYECENMVVRNNIIINSKTGVFQVNNVKNGFIYNNLAWNCSGYNSYRGLIYVSPGNGPGSQMGTVHLELKNNIFYNDASVQTPTQLMQISSTTLDSFSHTNNLYYFNGAALPTTGGYNPSTEAACILSDPKLPPPKGETYEEILRSMTPATKGPWVDAGIIVKTSFDLLFKTTDADIATNPRNDGKIDIGPFEFPVTTSNFKLFSQSLVTTRLKPTKCSQGIFYLNGAKAPASMSRAHFTGVYFTVKRNRQQIGETVVFH